jgi:hypothetical protein
MDKLEFNNENPILGIKETSPSKKLNIGGQQTAVEWLWRWQMDNEFASFEQGVSAYKQAKAMEKEQIIEAYRQGVEEDVYNNPLKTGDEYYDEKYNSSK